MVINTDISCCLCYRLLCERQISIMIWNILVKLCVSYDEESTAEYIDETNRSLKERVSDHGNQNTSANRNHHISTKHPKAELKYFTIIDRDSNTYTIEQKKHFTFVSKFHHSTETLAKSESIQYSTNFSNLPDN